MMLQRASRRQESNGEEGRSCTYVNHRKCVVNGGSGQFAGNVSDETDTTSISFGFWVLQKKSEREAETWRQDVL